MGATKQIKNGVFFEVWTNNAQNVQTIGRELMKNLINEC